jgi:hypothetical protein
VDTRAVAVGIGDSFGLVRWDGDRPGDGLQIDLAAVLHAQFDGTRRSFDFLNADFIVGFPVAYRRQRWSMRIRPYHWSAHVGDEFLLRKDDLERFEISVEGIESTVSRDHRMGRIYGGLDLLVTRVPDRLPPVVLTLGTELRRSDPWFDLGPFAARPLAGAHVRANDVEGWRLGWSARAGLELGRARNQPGEGRRLAIVLDVFDGHSPFGQFFEDELRYWGASIRLRP